MNSLNRELIDLRENLKEGIKQSQKAVGIDLLGFLKGLILSSIQTEMFSVVWSWTRGLGPMGLFIHPTLGEDNFLY